MKLKKLILLIPLMVSMAACSGNNSVAGTYSFQLGADTGTHAGIRLNLTETPYEKEVETTDNAKKFSLEFSFGGKGGVAGNIFDMIGSISDLINGGDEEESSSETSESSSESSSSTSDSSSGSDVPVTINGYYYLQEVEVHETNGKVTKQNRLKMGIDVLGDMGIDPDIMEMILYATLEDDTVNVVIPVSINDFLYQVYWYGYRIDLSVLTSFKPVDLEEESNGVIIKHDIGTHPAKPSDDEELSRDVAIIRGYQKTRKETPAPTYDIAEDFYLDFRDYHTLKMGLMKNGK